MIDCPGGCGSRLSGSAVCCNLCGWQAQGSNAGGPRRHPAHGYRLCVHESRGQPCAKVGRFAPLGAKDHWYCEAHFPSFGSHGASERDQPRGGFKAIRAMLNAIDKGAAEERAAIQAEGA